jgi:hypothetical protein
MEQNVQLSEGSSLAALRQGLMKAKPVILLFLEWAYQSRLPPRRKNFTVLILRRFQGGNLLRVV